MKATWLTCTCQPWLSEIATATLFTRASAAASSVSCRSTMYCIALAHHWSRPISSAHGHCTATLTALKWYSTGASEPHRNGRHWSAHAHSTGHNRSCHNSTPGGRGTRHAHPRQPHSLARGAAASRMGCSFMARPMLPLSLSLRMRKACGSTSSSNSTPVSAMYTQRWQW